MPEQFEPIATITTTTTTTTKTTIQKPKFIARSVSTTLIILGIVAELFALILITVENKDKMVFAANLSFLNMIVLYSLIASMLIHHFFIMNNFKKIDSSDETELRKMGFGDWVCNKNWEDYLRFPIFILFAVLTVEIPYIFAVGMKINAHVTHTTEIFNLEWLTMIFVSGSFFLAALMLFWNIVGLIYDKRNPFKTKKTSLEDGKAGGEGETKTVINSYPFPSAVSAFLWSDIFAFLVWLCFFYMFVLGKWYMNDLLKFFATIYIFIILLRAVGAFSDFFKTLFAKRE